MESESLLTQPFDVGLNLCKRAGNYFEPVYIDMSRRPSIVDLTSTSSRPYLPLPRSPATGTNIPSSSLPTRLPLRSSREPRGTKRRRDSVDSPEDEPGEAIESIDLTEVDDSSALAKALSKQREDAVKAQQATQSENGRSALTAYKCPVCMDTPVDATSTSCGTQNSDRQQRTHVA